MVQLFFDSCKVRHILCTESQKGPACEERLNESFGLGLEENQIRLLGLGDSYFWYILNSYLGLLGTHVGNECIKLINIFFISIYYIQKGHP
jgi:hypothetical protein